MKKTILTFALIVSGLLSYAQNLKIQTNFGFTSHINKKEVGNMMLTNFIGIEFKDKFGIEYGYAYSLNSDDNSLQNYIQGNSQSWSAGKFNHLVALYWKTKRIDGISFNIGSGMSILKNFNTDGIGTNLKPYLKLGLDTELGKKWGAQINGGFGSVFIFTLGITKKL